MKSPAQYSTRISVIASSQRSSRTTSSNHRGSQRAPGHVIQWRARASARHFFPCVGKKKRLLVWSCVVSTLTQTASRHVVMHQHECWRVRESSKNNSRIWEPLESYRVGLGYEIAGCVFLSKTEERVRGCVCACVFLWQTCVMYVPDLAGPKLSLWSGQSSGLVKKKKAFQLGTVHRLWCV